MSSMNRYELLRYVALAAQRECNRMLAAALRELDLTPSQAEVLRVLADHAPLTVRGLGQLLICETGSPSRLAATLVDRGLVARAPDPADARSSLLELSDAGRTAAESVAAVEDSFYRELEDLLDPELVDTTIHTLDRLVGGRPAGTALRRRQLLVDARRSST
jgi:DNA-binding MarR family transcriptional regulator